MTDILLIILVTLLRTGSRMMGDRKGDQLGDDFSN